MRPEKMQKKRFIKDYLEPILIAVLIVLFIRAFAVQAFKIPSSSMEFTLLVGDYLLVNKFIYGIRIPYTDRKLFQFKKPQRRVIGTEGEKVEIIHNKIYINGRLIDDPWGHLRKRYGQNTSRRWKTSARSLSQKILYLF